MLIDRIAGPAGPVVRSATPEELQQRLAMPPPDDAVAFDEILDGLERNVLPFVAGSVIRDTSPSSRAREHGPGRSAI
jgi:hypothetical protein